MMLRVSILYFPTQLAYKETCYEPVMYENKHFLPKFNHLTSKLPYFMSKLRHFAIRHLPFHSHTEIDVKIFKFVFLDANNL